MRKIQFDLVIADGFHFPPPNKKDHGHLWPVSDGESITAYIEIEFEPSGGDVMREAEIALDEHMKNKYPNKDYKIYYWWWLD